MPIYWHQSIRSTPVFKPGLGFAKALEYTNLLFYTKNPILKKEAVQKGNLTVFLNLFQNL
jgi:hypothetical protein